MVKKTKKVKTSGYSVKSKPILTLPNSFIPSYFIKYDKEYWYVYGDKTKYGKLPKILYFGNGSVMNKMENIEKSKKKLLKSFNNLNETNVIKYKSASQKNLISVKSLILIKKCK